MSVCLSVYAWIQNAQTCGCPVFAWLPQRLMRKHIAYAKEPALENVEVRRREGRDMAMREMEPGWGRADACLCCSHALVCVLPGCPLIWDATISIGCVAPARQRANTGHTSAGVTWYRLQRPATGMTSTVCRSIARRLRACFTPFPAPLGTLLSFSSSPSLPPFFLALLFSFFFLCSSTRLPSHIWLPRAHTRVCVCVLCVQIVYGFANHCHSASLEASVGNKEFSTMVSTTQLQTLTGTTLHKLTGAHLALVFLSL